MREEVGLLVIGAFWFVLTAGVFDIITALVMWWVRVRTSHQGRLSNGFTWLSVATLAVGLSLCFLAATNRSADPLLWSLVTLVAVVTGIGAAIIALIQFGARWGR